MSIIKIRFYLFLCISLYVFTCYSQSGVYRIIASNCKENKSNECNDCLGIKIKGIKGVIVPIHCIIGCNTLKIELIPSKTKTQIISESLPFPNKFNFNKDFAILEVPTTIDANFRQINNTNTGYKLYNQPLDSNLHAFISYREGQGKELIISKTDKYINIHDFKPFFYNEYDTTELTDDQRLCLDQFESSGVPSLNQKILVADANLRPGDSGSPITLSNNWIFR